MKTFISRMALVAALGLLGCVPSLHSVYTENDLVAEPAIVGTWQQVKSENIWEFTQLTEKNYRLVYTDEQGRVGRFIAHVAQIEDLKFLDLFPEKGDVEASEFYKFHLVPFHTIYLIEGTSPQLQLVSLDLKWLNEYLMEHPDELQHATVNGQKLLTAPTVELQAFLLKHRDKFTGRFQLERRTEAATT